MAFPSNPLGYICVNDLVFTGSRRPLQERQLAASMPPLDELIGTRMPQAAAYGKSVHVLPTVLQYLYFFHPIKFGEYDMVKLLAYAFHCINHTSLHTQHAF